MNPTTASAADQDVHAGESPVRGKKICFVLFNYPLGVSTMVINSIALLARANQVDVLISKHDRKALPLDPWLHRRLTPFPNFSRLLPVRGCKFILQQLGRWMKLPATMPWWIVGNLDLFLLSYWLEKRLRERRYDILIPVECFSLIAVHRSSPGKADIVYYNLELLDWSADNPLYVNKTVLKALEHRALGAVKHVMITSPERRKIFATLNGFPLERISALPVAPLRRPDARRSRFFRDKFSIPDDRLVLVYSGNFAPWAQCLEIISSMDNWPANAVLVMHTWNKAAMAKEYFARMRRAAAGRAVHFSAEYLLYEELAGALSSADIGLLYYEAIDANFTEILFSSNKMAEYMAAGLPVICSPFPSLGKFVHEEHVGVAAEFGGIGPAAARIAADMEAYRASVADCRRRHFEFERYFSAAFSSYAGAGV